MEELVGKIIDKIFISKDEYTIAFQVDDGEVIAYSTVADCCSESWFADIIGLEAVKGYDRYRGSNLDSRRVRQVIECDMHWYNVEDGRGRQNFDQAYGYAIYTGYGVLKIAFRNSSNGYYGGWLCQTKNADISKMKEIHSDWSA